MADNNSFQIPTSVNQQIDSAKQIVAGAQSQFSQAISDVTSAADKLTSDAIKAGQSLLGSGKAALNQLGAYTTVSKFVDNLGKAKPVLDIRPEGTKGKITQAGGIKQLQYPLDLGHYFIRFTFMNHYKPNAIVPRKEIPATTIFMPLPGELNERYGVQYADKPLGVLGLLQESGLIDSLNTDKLDEGKLKEAGAGLAKQLTQPGNLGALGMALVGGTDGSVGSAITRAAGAVLNPYQALAFQGVELRNHSFRFRCSPNSEAESKALKEIIQKFKVHMLPEKRGLLLNFPDVCTIEFQTRDMPYSFKNCYLKSMSCNYAPSGTPSFFKQGKYPTEVDIQLEFGEIEPVFRNDVESGNLTGNFGQAYGKPSGTPIASTPIASDPGKTVPSRSAPKAASKPVTRPQTLQEKVTGQTSPLVNDQGMDFNSLI